jgi:hypothetical protein
MHLHLVEYLTSLRGLSRMSSELIDVHPILFNLQLQIMQLSLSVA